jgi:hypothetical protein
MADQLWNPSTIFNINGETLRHFTSRNQGEKWRTMCAPIINAKILDLRTCNGSACPAFRFIHYIRSQRRVPELIRHMCQ